MAIQIPPIVRTQEAIDTPFDNTTNGFVSDNVQSAIEEARVNAILFSGYDFIPASWHVIIPQYQQSVIYQQIDIEGTLDIEGKLIVSEL